MEADSLSELTNSFRIYDGLSYSSFGRDNANLQLTSAPPHSPPHHQNMDAPQLFRLPDDPEMVHIPDAPLVRLHHQLQEFHDEKVNSQCKATVSN